MNNFIWKNFLFTVVYFALVILCVTPFISSPISLLLGIIYAICCKNPFEKYTHAQIHLLLKVAIVGLGFGLNAHEALEAGKSGIILTICSIIAVLSLGYVLGRLLKLETVTAYLISVGTAICGGSAIAAITPILKPDNKQISLSLAIIFTLNSIALFLYPFIGGLLHLSQEQFGLWAAIGIHDTSSVVGAANKYGTTALKIATTVKLARALWIIPVSFFTMFISKSRDNKVKIPWFIILFIIAIVANTYLPAINRFSPYILAVSKAGLNLTLFLIGTTLTLPLLKTITWRPMVVAILLWVFISISSLVAIMNL